MTNILWIIVAAIVGLWLLSLVLKLFGFFIGIAMFVLHYALIAAIIIVVFNLLTGRKKL
jgi:hypothetical protein